MSFEEQPDEDHSECKRAYETAIAEIAAKAQTEWAARNDAEKRASAYKAEKEIAEHSLLEAQAQIDRIRGVIGDAGFMEADCAECRRNMDIVSRALSDSSSSPAALQAALDEARAEAFRDASVAVRSHLIYTGPGGYDPEPIQHRLADMLEARALSPRPSTTTGEEPKP